MGLCFKWRHSDLRISRKKKTKKNKKTLGDLAARVVAATLLLCLKWRHSDLRISREKKTKKKQKNFRRLSCQSGSCNSAPMFEMAPFRSEDISRKKNKKKQKKTLGDLAARV